MKAKILVFVSLIVVSVSLYSCLTQEEKDEKIARTYCGNCHVFPEPALLSKNSWMKGVLPQMAFRMGRDYARLSVIPEPERTVVMKILPQRRMVTDEEWQAIERYYKKNSPDSLDVRDVPIADTLIGFQAEPYRISKNPTTTTIRFDSLSGKIFVGNRQRLLYRFDSSLKLEHTDTLPTPPSYIQLAGNAALVLQMGIMDPNDQPRGSLLSMNLEDKSRTTIIDSLKRPVFFEKADLNKDGLEDIVICSFGHYTGDLTIYSPQKDGSYKRISLLEFPGARKVIIRDFDNNGMPDILALMSQGDEKIMMLLNQGDFKFRINTLASFPPVYGSCYFDIADFNNDGKFDILYVNGDNADYSRALKPYHGVRILLNNGKNEFKESWFYNMHGAIQAIARDFDNDGDLDIAAISMFPDFNSHPEQGFIYFENNGSGYSPRITRFGAIGRWMTMDVGDIDRDGDMDILLGALNFYDGVPDALLKSWNNNPVSVLLLRNQHIN